VRRALRASEKLTFISSGDGSLKGEKENVSGDPGFQLRRAINHKAGPEGKKGTHESRNGRGSGNKTRDPESVGSPPLFDWGGGGGGEPGS